MKSFRITDFSLLSDNKLDEVIGRLREAHKKSRWASMEDPLGELETIRNG